MCSSECCAASWDSMLACKCGTMLINLPSAKCFCQFPNLGEAKNSKTQIVTSLCSGSIHGLQQVTSILGPKQNTTFADFSSHSPEHDVLRQWRQWSAIFPLSHGRKALEILQMQDLDQRDPEATRSKGHRYWERSDATRGSWPYYVRNKRTLRTDVTNSTS